MVMVAAVQDVARCAHCHVGMPAKAKFCPSCGREQAPIALVFGDYEATELVGEGGMGRVYKAVQRSLNRAVCIKTLLPQFAGDPVAAARFAKEATNTAGLSHPNIVSVFDVGHSVDGSPFMVMELIDGRPLRAILRDEAPVPAARAVRLMDQVLAALGEAHTHGLVHRDLKPNNVLVVSLRDGTEHCKVLDFGIAKVVEAVGVGEALTRAGSVVGTPGYMAPEQVLGLEVDSRSDLYAAGVLLYELLTGQHVFSSRSTDELMKQTVLEDPPPPSSRTTTHVSAALDAVCLKALAREPDERFATASEFREALAQVTQASTASTRNLRVKVDCSPLATFANDQRRNGSQTDLRALLSAMLAASDEWERAQLIEPFERSLRDQLLQGDFERVRVAITALQAEQRERGVNLALKALLDTTRALILEQLPLLLQWLVSDARRTAAQWLLRLPGRGALTTYLQRLPELDAETQHQLLLVAHTMDPDSSTLVSLLRTAAPGLLRPLLANALRWPEDQGLALFSAVLQSPEPAIRQLALEVLDERSAFRLAPLIRHRLHDPVAAVRVKALQWVCRVEDEAAIDDLASLLERPLLPLGERRSVWRALLGFDTDGALAVLARALERPHDLDQASELCTLLVRSGSTQVVSRVREVAGRASTPKLKRVLDEALRVV